MGLFNFGKKEKKKEVSKEKCKEEPFEAGSAGLIFNSKIQIIASPKDYAKKVAQNYIETIKSSKDLKQKTRYHILKYKIDSPQKLKENEKTDKHEKDVDLYKVFIDMDIGVKDKSLVFDFCFDFMPFSIEIIEPMNINMSAADMTEYLTSIQSTIHKIDESMKRVNAANQLLSKQNQNLMHSMVRMLRNNVILSLKEKNKDLKELSKNTGISEEQIKPFIDNMVKDNEIKLEKNKYKVVK